MKAYTLRLDDNVLETLKHIGIKERKTVREIMLELIEKKISANSSRNESIKEQKEMEKVVRLLNRASVERVIKSIRKDRER